MKIDGQRPTQDTEATDAARKTAADPTVKRTAVNPASGAPRDRVEVSADAQLLTAAIDATHKAPAIRTDLVERMKQKLNAGEIGNDSGRLADKIIDDLLNNKNK